MKQLNVQSKGLGLKRGRSFVLGCTIMKVCRLYTILLVIALLNLELAKCQRLGI